MNIVLIGMPGVGKSTIGIILAKILGRDFIDTDVYIQTREEKNLQDIINTQGLDSFCDLEEGYIISLSCTNSVIATGGSVVYSNRAMRHLKDSGILIHLYVPFSVLQLRLTNITTRGIVMRTNQGLMELFNERLPLYEKYADIRIDCQNKNHEEVIAAILEKIHYDTFEN
jgi:shikimate kinase